MLFNLRFTVFHKMLDVAGKGPIVEIMRLKEHIVPGEVSPVSMTILNLNYFHIRIAYVIESHVCKILSRVQSEFTSLMEAGLGVIGLQFLGCTWYSLAISI